MPNSTIRLEFLPAGSTVQYQNGHTLTEVPAQTFPQSGTDYEYAEVTLPFAMNNYLFNYNSTAFVFRWIVDDVGSEPINPSSDNENLDHGADQTYTYDWRILQPEATSDSEQNLINAASAAQAAAAAEAAAEPAASDNSGVEFVLTALNSEMTTSLFSLVAEGAVEDVLEAKYKHKVALNVSADKWNNVFWLAPQQSDTNDPDGLPNATALYDIDIFEEEVIKYHTKKDNMTAANLNYSNTTDAALEAGTFSIESNTMPTSEACIKAWSKDIFQQEKMDDIWNNRTAVKGEINQYITSTATDSSKNLLEQLKVIVGNADKKTNLDINTSVDGEPVNTKENLTRQLLLQLHKAVAGNGEEGEARLLNGTGGIFEASNQTHTDGNDKYYAFLFKANDTLTFGMTIKHPDQYRTAGADGDAMLEDTQSNNQGAFDGGDKPRDMDFKITITMT
jgi:hypothetical protein